MPYTRAARQTELMILGHPTRSSTNSRGCLVPAEVRLRLRPKDLTRTASLRTLSRRCHQLLTSTPSGADCSQLLRPEVERHAPWWSYLGAVCGQVDSFSSRAYELINLQRWRWIHYRQLPRPHAWCRGWQPSWCSAGCERKGCGRRVQRAWWKPEGRGLFDVLRKKIHPLNVLLQILRALALKVLGSAL